MNSSHKIDVKLCRAALEKLAEGPCGYEMIRKHVIRVTACGSSGKINRAIRDIVRNRWAEKTGPRGSRAPYRITEAGKLFLLSFGETGGPPT